MKCRSATPPLYVGQPKDEIRKEIAKKFISSSSFETINIDKDGNCLYKTVSMFIFGNQDYHIQLRLASIYIILYYSDYFRRVMINTEGEYNYKDELIPHIDNLITEISRPGSWGRNIIMIALSAIQLIFGNFLYIYITSDYLKKENIFKFKVFHKVYSLK